MKPNDVSQEAWDAAKDICDQACMPEHYYVNGVVIAVQEDIARAITAAVAAEREACAQYHDGLLAEHQLQLPEAVSPVAIQYHTTMVRAHKQYAAAHRTRLGVN